MPDDQELLADLTAPTFEVRTSGILIESKDAIRKRLGRSTNKGDAVVMALHPGNKAIERALRSNQPPPKVIFQHQAQKMKDWGMNRGGRWGR